LTNANHVSSPPEAPRLLLLNGTSSAGKTSLLHALQDRFDQPFLEVGLDKFLWMLPKRYLQPHFWQEIFTYEYRHTPGEAAVIERIHPGELGERLITGMHQAAAALLAAGHYLLLDHVLLKSEWVWECARLFKGYRAYLIGVRCPLEIVEQRERQRHDRTLGQARAQYAYVHAYGPYDFEVDTSWQSPEQAAEAIYEFISYGPPPQAFQRLYKTLRS
jgi:chloramphenicol 3-O phosphotransferase